MSGGFFRGTSADQDTRFSNKQAKLMKSQKFPPELENLVDITKVKMDVMRPWIANRVTELLGFEDEVLINFIYGLLDGKVVNGKEIQISITGFMEKNTAKFMKELWTLLLSAEKNASGVPQQFLDAKEEETRKKKVETDRITHEIQKRKEKEARELEQEKEDKMAGKVDNSTRADYDAFGTTSRQRKPRDSSIRSSEDEKEANGRDRSRERIRETPSRSNSRSFSNSRSRSEHRSRSLSVSPRKRRSDSVERVHRSPPRRSPTPHRRDSPQRSFSPVRQTSHYRQRSITPPHRRSPSPVRRRSRSPIRRRSRSPLRRRSRSPLRRRSRSPVRRRSRTPLRRRSRTPLRRRSRTPLRRRSRTPLRRRRSPVRYRSRSPIRRRSGSPIRRRSRSPIHRRSPVRHESSSPVRGRSPSPVRRRSPAPVRHESFSPVRGRSPSPVRRRSPAPVRRRFPSLVQGRSPSPVRQLSRSPVRHQSRSPVRHQSRSPVRHQSPSPVGRRSSPLKHGYRRSSSSPRQRRSTPKSHSSPREMSPHSPIHLPDSEVKISLKHQSPPVETPRNRIRTQEQYSPARQTTRREVIKYSSETRKGSTLERQIHKSSQRSPQRDRSGRNSLHGGVPSLSPSPYSSPDGSDSPPTSRPKSLGQDSRASSRHESPQRAPVVDNIRASPRQKSKGNMAIPVGQPMEKALGSSEAEDPKGKSSRKKMMHSPAPEVLAQKDNHDVKGGGTNESGTVDRKSIIDKERNNRGSDDSDYGASGKHRSEAREKRKHKRSKRRESGDDDDDDQSSDSQLEGRKAAKRRRKEEKKLRKEERRRRREERRRRRDERRAKKIELKTVGVSPQSDLAENHQDYISDGARAARRDSHSSDSEVSEQKKLEIALREKALETLRAKKSAGR